MAIFLVVRAGSGNFQRFQTSRLIFSISYSHFTESDESSSEEEGDHRCAYDYEVGQCVLEDVKFFYDKFHKTCYPKLMGDCNGDRNLFNSGSACEETCYRDN